LSLNDGTLAYHLQVLEREEIIKSMKDGKYRRFYPFTAKIPEEGGAPKRIQRLILEVIRSTPGICQKDIACLLNLTRSTINYHIERLKQMGLVECRREGMRVCWYTKRER